MSDSIPLSVPSLQGNEWLYVKECLDTEWVSTAGKYVDLFEQKITEYTGSKFAIACVNGTSALQVALRIAGVHSGDEILVPTLTFIAPINAIAYNNAKPVFMDADKYYNIDVAKTIEFINKETFYNNGNTYNKATHNKITAIIPVHIWGNAANLEELVPLCEERNIKVIEDASESLGSVYAKGKYSGKHTGTVGKLGCISFNGNKIITSGGGGMIITDDEKIAEKARYLTTQAKDDPVRYEHHEIGYNFRLTNIQAALGVAQLEQLPLFLRKKKSIFNGYNKAIRGIEGVDIANVPSYSNNNHWLNVLNINKRKFAEDRDTLMKRLKTLKIETRPVWGLCHLQKPYSKCQTYNIDRAYSLLNYSLCLPSSFSLTDSQIAKITKALLNT
jgi:perosamine synthetase